MGNPMSTDLTVPLMGGRNLSGRKRREDEKAADLAYEAWRRDMIYRIYGPQETPVKTRRGRR